MRNRRRNGKKSRDKKINADRKANLEKEYLFIANLEKVEEFILNTAWKAKRKERMNLHGKGESMVDYILADMEVRQMVEKLKIEDVIEKLKIEDVESSDNSIGL